MVGGGVVGGGVVGGGVVGGGVVGGGVVGGGVVGGGVVPLHATPFRLNPVGAPPLEPYVPCNPNSVEPPAGMLPLHDALRAVTVDPDWLTVAFQPLVTRSSPAYVQVTVQLETAASPGETLTAAVNPPGHWLGV